MQKSEWAYMTGIREFPARVKMFPGSLLTIIPKKKKDYP